MSNSKKLDTSSEAMESLLNNVIHRAEDVCRDKWGKLEDKVRESPGAAILIATGIGLCLHRLPLRSLLATQLKLLWAFAPPALMAAAAGKAFLAMDEKLHPSNGSSPSPPRPKKDQLQPMSTNA